MIVTDEMVEKSKGTKTEHFATQVEVDEILSLLTQTMDQTEHDIERYFHKLYGISTPLGVRAH
jgi:hypothetical protein